jgi:hypothetical protein
LQDIGDVAPKPTTSISSVVTGLMTIEKKAHINGKLF